MNIFYENDLRQYLENNLLKVVSSIESETDDYLLNVNESDYIKYKTDAATVDLVYINEKEIYATTSEQMIPAEYFRNSFFVEEGQTYKKVVIKFHVPFMGNKDLLWCTPSTRIMWTTKVELHNGEITFEIINFDNDAQYIAREKDSIISNILRQLENVSKDTVNYNNNLGQRIKAAFETRKRNVLMKHDLLSSLGVPIKKTGGVSSTFSIPTPATRKKIKIEKPIVSEVGFTPEPTLDVGMYNQILQLIHDVGKGFERLPSLYAGKEEEHLRDHFLMILEPNFEGSATGETFNKTGKTDILLRYEGSNVFIAECKFWRGQKAFLETISQLLGYLTWRDSKVAVIVFVPNKDFSSVLETVTKEISEHPNYIEYIDAKDETWLNYRFHLNNDRNRAVSLAVMLYHLPKSEG